MGELITKLKRPVVENPESDRRDWVNLLDDLVHHFETWIGKDWATDKLKKPMRDSVLGAYEAPGLLMQLNYTRVILEPIARYAPGTDGVVDLARMPAYDLIASLYRIKDEWRLHYAFQYEKAEAGARSAVSLPLNELNLRRVLDEFTGHVV